jgi:hypothetical protein
MMASEEPIQEVPIAFSSSSCVAAQKIGQNFIADSEAEGYAYLAEETLTSVKQASDHADTAVLNLGRSRVLFVVDEVLRECLRHQLFSFILLRVS